MGRRCRDGLGSDDAQRCAVIASDNRGVDAGSLEAAGYVVPKYQRETSIDAPLREAGRGNEPRACLWCKVPE